MITDTIILSITYYTDTYFVIGERRIRLHPCGEKNNKINL